MAEIIVDTREVDDLAVWLRKKISAVRKVMPDLVGDLTEKVEGEAKRLCPVDTGALQSSIHIEKKEKHRVDVVAGSSQIRNPKSGVTTDEYAAYVEYGTARAPAQPYMRPAVDRELPKAVNNMARKIAEILKGG